MISGSGGGGMSSRSLTSGDSHLYCNVQETCVLRDQ